MVAAPVYGSIQEYQPDNELFSSYLERVELYFAANDIPNDKKVPVFLSVLGSVIYSLLRAPACPKTCESISKYVAELRRLTIHCQYGSRHYGIALCVAYGMYIHTQKKLLAMDLLTLTEAIEIALGEEAADGVQRLLEKKRILWMWSKKVQQGEP